MDDNRINHLAAWFRTGDRIVFLTGAGMSTESGIPDFRSPTGLYANGISEDVFEISVFRREPEHFYRFARRFLGELRRARPNAGHRAMAALAREFGKDVRVITQNIDTLHQAAGSPVVHPVHGTLATSSCAVCGERVASDTLWPQVERGCVPRHPACGGVFKPDIVFFGELLPTDVFAAAEAAVREADVLVIAGTSLTVHPAAGLPALRSPQCRLGIVNRSPTPLDARAQLRFAEGIGTVLETAVACLRGAEVGKNRC